MLMRGNMYWILFVNLEMYQNTFANNFHATYVINKSQHPLQTPVYSYVCVRWNSCLYMCLLVGIPLKWSCVIL